MGLVGEEASTLKHTHATCWSRRALYSLRETYLEERVKNSQIYIVDNQGDHLNSWHSGANTRSILRPFW